MQVTLGLIVAERNWWIRVSPHAATPLRAIEAFGEALGYQVRNAWPATTEPLPDRHTSSTSHWVVSRMSMVGWFSRHPPEILPQSGVARSCHAAVRFF